MTVNCMALSFPKVSYAHFRTDRISLTAAIPLLAMSTYHRATCQPVLVQEARRIGSRC